MVLVYILYNKLAFIYVNIISNSENAGSGQQCCYSSDGGLIVGPKAGGTVDRYAPGQHFWQHQFHDVLPFIFCCYGLFSDCSAYYEKRPSDNGDGYDLIPPGRFVFLNQALAGCRPGRLVS